jgi:hypothetical protein
MQDDPGLQFLLSSSTSVVFILRASIIRMIKWIAKAKPNRPLLSSWMTFVIAASTKPRLSQFSSLQNMLRSFCIDALIGIEDMRCHANAWPLYVLWNSGAALKYVGSQIRS